MYIEKATHCTDEIVSAVQRLVPMLGADKPLPTHEQLAAVIQSAASTLILARYPAATDPVAGMLTISLYPVPTGMRAIIEDVAVDVKYRRKGIARALMQYAIEFAHQAGAHNISLTSSPQREAANLLYQTLGFEKRTTNAYIYRIK